ncbi:MAG TPA: CoA-binding protein [Leptolyngbyaceae cyanobacterium]
MPYTLPSDETLRQLLTNTRTIAVVGHSDRPDRVSYRIAQYLRQAGYHVFPVNPTVASIDGERCYATLADLPEAVDMVNVFRRSEFLPAVVEEAIEANARAVWAQLGISHPDAAAKAQAVGVPLVMDACIKIEHHRLAIQFASPSQ